MSGGPVPVWKKYTTGSTGIWERIRRVLALVPNRSTGNPVVKLYRNPPPGSRIPDESYQDPHTIPAGDIINNDYFKRDHRRNYPKTAGYDQYQIAGLLKLGSVAKPRISIGAKGSQELAVVSNKEVSLAKELQVADKSVLFGEVLTATGQPPVAPAFRPKKWTILPESKSGMYTEDYPCRTFT